MIQEILTYMIIGSAITLAVIKIRNKFRGKKKSKKTDFKKESFTLKHNCSDCSAECILRDTTSPVILNNRELCTKVELKSD